MHTFLTPEPITIEIRNASGEIRVDLADVPTTTVDVVATASHPFGFLDDVIRAVTAKAQFAGDRMAHAGGKSRFDKSGFGGADCGPSGFGTAGFGTAGFGTAGSGTAGSGTAGFGTADAGTADPGDDPSERVRVDLRESPAEAGPSTLIVDTDPARDGWKSSFIVNVTAPSGSGIRIQTQSADVTVTGRSDRLETRTASGDVRVDEVVGRSVVQTASGDVTITATADCDVRTASGDIEVHRVTADAVVHSTSGDIRLDYTAGNINARSVSGDIRVMDATAGRAEVVTVSGDVEIGIHAGSLTAVDLSTISGDTDTDFEVSDEAPASDGSPDGANAGEDDGPILNLRVKTTSGDIRLRRAVAA